MATSSLCPHCGHPPGKKDGLYRGKQRYICAGPSPHKFTPGISKPKPEKTVIVQAPIEQSLVQQIDDLVGKGKRSEFIRGAIAAALATENTP